jgi:hypothetical protein
VKTPAKWSAYQIPSVSVVFVILVFKGLVCKSYSQMPQEALNLLVTGALLSTLLYATVCFYIICIANKMGLKKNLIPLKIIICFRNSLIVGTTVNGACLPSIHLHPVMLLHTSTWKQFLTKSTNYICIYCLWNLFMIFLTSDLHLYFHLSKLSSNFSTIKKNEKKLSIRTTWERKMQ